MAVNISYPFTTASNYLLSNTAIRSGNGELDLINKTGLSFTENFDSDAGFTFDSSKASVGANLETDESAYASYNDDINLSIGLGTLTGTGTGSPVITSGKLDLTGLTVKYVDYDANLNADSQQTGCVRIKVTPNYSGVPTGDKVFFVITKADGDADNAINLLHKIATGNLDLGIFDSTGAAIINVSLGVFSPTAGVEVEFELNWDITAGATRLFKDGVQFGSTQSDTGTRDSGIGLLRIGSDFTGVSTSDFFVNDLQIYSTVQHTANYTSPLLQTLDAQQVIQQPTNNTFYAQYNLAGIFDADISDDGKTGTTAGAPTVSGGFANFPAANDLVSYSDTANFGVNPNTGTIEFRVKTDYTGSPAATRGLFILKTLATGFNDISVRHNNTGNITLAMTDSAGVTFINANVGIHSPTAGVEDDWSINWSLTGVLGTSAIRVFKNGVQFGATFQSASTRDTSVDFLSVGGIAAFHMEGSINWFRYWKAVQYTANYSVPSEPDLFSEVPITLPTLTDPGPGKIQVLGALTVSEIGAPKYIPRVSGVDYFWTGTLWDTSTGTYIQSTTKADWNANISSFSNIDENSSFDLKVVFPDGNTKNIVDTLSLSYTAQEYTASGTLEGVTSFTAESIVSFISTEVLGGETLRYALRANTVLKYHDGADWVNSDGSNSQTNTRAEMIANVGTLISDLGVNADIKPFVLLETANQSGGSAVTPQIDVITFSFDFGATQPTLPVTTNVFGFLLDALNVPIVGATVEIRFDLDTGEYNEAANHLVLAPLTTTTTDSNGFWDLDLIRSSEFEKARNYTLVIKDVNNKKLNFLGGDNIVFTVPDQTSVNITSLITAV